MTDTLTPAELMTAEEFYTYCANRDGRMELVEGKVVEMPPVGCDYQVRQPAYTSHDAGTQPSLPPCLLPYVVITPPPVGPRHGSLDTRLARRIGGFVEDSGVGDYFLNTGFLLQRRRDQVRAPDQAFVSAEKMNACPAPERGFWPVAPDLAVEIVSPGNSAQDLNDKVGDYLRAGVQLVWVFYANREQVHVYRGRRPMEILERPQTLSGEDVLPGLELPLASIWR